MRVQSNVKLLKQKEIRPLYDGISKMAAEGLSVNQIGRIIGASGDTIRNCLKEDGEVNVLELLYKNGKQRRKTNLGGAIHGNRSL